jgi:hypothetical protein
MIIMIYVNGDFFLVFPCVCFVNVVIMSAGSHDAGFFVVESSAGVTVISREKTHVLGA